ncbi:CBS domain-containing protein [Streptomyces griseorubiginosus]|uniref:CBS domain-containing protein n=1 Tax=Streptomyces griseorubiginosus TaxID=67304 RepID=UPI001AD7375C|nr:CBS domain-containing protein [Streptomyces griseorubiginosus]MBO4257815.1 CBS domain-containing protein [Streptomyces griseorubiginosus]
MTTPHATPHIVSDVMTRSVVTARRGEVFKDIVRTMQDHRVSALPVVDDDGHVVGIVSEADLLPKEEFRDSDPDRSTQLRRLSDLAKAGSLTAEELMTAPALTVEAGATLAQAARTMARTRVKRLPVVDGTGRLEGVVSRADLLKVFLREDESIAEEVRREVVAYLFPAPASAVRVEVHEGVVLLAGRVRDRSLVPVAARQVRAVEGVVDVRFDLSEAAPAAELSRKRPATR